MKILVIGGMHGNEPLGVEVVRLLQASPVPGIDTYIANPKAVQANTRFIDEDLNRAFPGDAASRTYEKRRAKQVLAKTAPYDLVLDFHNTQADQPACGFVGLTYDKRLLHAAASLGLQHVIEASYDCINKYAPNCLSVEVCLGENKPAAWYDKLLQLSTLTSFTPTIYRYVRRVTWEECEGLGTSNWQPFRELPGGDKNVLGINGSVCPIFIGSRLTPFYATLVSRIETSGTIETKELGQ